MTSLLIFSSRCGSGSSLFWAYFHFLCAATRNWANSYQNNFFARIDSSGVGREWVEVCVCVFSFPMNNVFKRRVREKQETPRSYLTDHLASKQRKYSFDQSAQSKQWNSTPRLPILRKSMDVKVTFFQRKIVKNWKNFTFSDKMASLATLRVKSDQIASEKSTSSAKKSRNDSDDSEWLKIAHFSVTPTWKIYFCLKSRYTRNKINIFIFAHCHFWPRSLKSTRIYSELWELWRYAPGAPDFKFQSFSCTLLAQVISNTTRFSTVRRRTAPRGPVRFFFFIFEITRIG